MSIDRMGGEHIINKKVLRKQTVDILSFLCHLSSGLQENAI